LTKLAKIAPGASEKGERYQLFCEEYYASFWSLPLYRFPRNQPNSTWIDVHDPRKLFFSKIFWIFLL